MLYGGDWMRKKVPPVWICAVLLLFALIWRMIGAPVNAEQFQNLKIPFRQAAIQLPGRSARIWLNWFRYQQEEVQTMDQEVENEKPDDAEAVWLNVYIAQEKKLARMTLQGYVCGVVAQEMPAAYHLEALKAQAVAARTRAVAQMLEGGCSRYPGADICTDSAHCQGYATLAHCKEKWGESYSLYRDRILTAERETRGEIITFEGKPITVFYHAISGGSTEDAHTVFSQELPYLLSVKSPGEEKTRGFEQEVILSYEEAARKLSQYTSKEITAQEVRRSLSIVSYTPSGRVEQIQVGEHQMAATVLREILNLRSTRFSISMDEDGIHFHQQGYGHGVGMSQAGANAMASDGKTYHEILLHYYTGVELTKE